MMSLSSYPALVHYFEKYLQVEPKELEALLPFAISLVENRLPFQALTSSEKEFFLFLACGIFLSKTPTGQMPQAIHFGEMSFQFASQESFLPQFERCVLAYRQKHRPVAYIQ